MLSRTDQVERDLISSYICESDTESKELRCKRWIFDVENQYLSFSKGEKEGSV